MDGARRDIAVTGNKAIDWRLFAALYALVAATFIARAVFNVNHAPLIADTDDAMRLVVVRDLLAGQGWFDPIQHRLNTPFGAEIHWSRLADLPLAALLLVCRPLFGGLAETVAVYAVPLLLLAPLLYFSARLTVTLVGREGLLPGLALPAFTMSVLSEFAPGRVDHHALQIILMLALVWSAIEALERPRFALGAGLAAATSLAIGIEGLPIVFAALTAFGLMWVTVPARAPQLRGFGLSFALAMLAHLAVALPPARWLAPMCDAISIVYVAAAAGTGIAFVALSLLPVAGRSPWLRLALGIAAGAALALGIGLAFPDCLRGPYSALDPWLVENWLDRIREAQPVWVSLRDDVVYPLAVLVPSLVALAVAAWQARRWHDGQGGWLVYLLFLAVAIAVMLVQIRASRLATPLAVPGGAGLIVMARGWYLERRTIWRIAPLVGSWMVSAGIAVAVVAGIAVPAPVGNNGAGGSGVRQAQRQQCLQPEAFAALAAMPPERIMTPIDLGSHMLAFTPHAVAAAPYHRNAEGVLDAFHFFNWPIDEARKILERRGISLIVICPAMSEVRGLPSATPDSFAKLYATGKLPPWIVDRSLPDSPLKMFAVMPD